MGIVSSKLSQSQGLVWCDSFVPQKCNIRIVEKQISGHILVIWALWTDLKQSASWTGAPRGSWLVKRHKFMINWSLPTISLLGCTVCALQGRLSMDSCMLAMDPALHHFPPSITG